MKNRPGISLLYRFSIIFFLIFPVMKTTSAQDYISKFKTSGLSLGFAPARNHVHYNVLLFAADFSQSFKKPKKKSFLTWYWQPQINLVKAATTPRNKLDYEFGVNLGLRNYIKVNDNFYLYDMISSGPHFISAIVYRQARGFNFSDNIALGSLIHLSKNYFLRLQAGLRHISNGEIKEPNKGIDSFLFMAGLSRIK